MPDTKGREWMARAEELRHDFHVREQVQRLMEPLTLIRGHKEVSSYEDVVTEAARLIAMLEIHPEQQQTANSGGLMVARGPMEGYSIMVHAADVYVMHMGQKIDENGRQLDERNWRRAMDFWSAGQEAKIARFAQAKEVSDA